MARRQQWEYDTTRDGDKDSSSMKAMGEMGWELVCAMPAYTGPPYPRLYWKRPKQ